MAELADARDLKSLSRNRVRVQFPLPAPDYNMSTKSLPREENISRLIDYCTKGITNIPKEDIESMIHEHISRSEDLEKSSEEIMSFVRKVIQAEKLVNQEIDPNISNNSIILIGPMGTGKTTVSKEIQKRNNMPLISLDNRDQLHDLYEEIERNGLKGKDAEFYLVARTLTSMEKPSIIAFGAGHGDYPNKIMEAEMEVLLNKFPNVICLEYSENKEESLEVLNQRISQREGDQSRTEQVLKANKHFVYDSSFDTFAQKTIYTKGSTPEEVADEILDFISTNKK